MYGRACACGSLIGNTNGGMWSYCLQMAASDAETEVDAGCGMRRSLGGERRRSCEQDDSGMCMQELCVCSLSSGGRVQRGGFSGLQASSSGGSGGTMSSPPLAGRWPPFPPSEPAARASSK